VVESRARAGREGQRGPGREPEPGFGRRGPAGVDADVTGQPRVCGSVRARARRRLGGDGGRVRPDGLELVIVAGQIPVNLDLGRGALPGVPGRERRERPSCRGSGRGSCPPSRSARSLAGRYRCGSSPRADGQPQAAISQPSRIRSVAL
jgi:hypothetical protein